MVGRLVWANISFGDLNFSSKKRPILIIGGPVNNDYNFLPVSSKKVNEKFDFELNKEQLSKLKLYKTSYVKINKQGFINKNGILLNKKYINLQKLYPNLFEEIKTRVLEYQKEILINRGS